jgi:hypothetical protein
MSRRIVAGAAAAAALIATALVAVPQALEAAGTSAAITTRVIHGGQLTKIARGSTSSEIAPGIGPEAQSTKAPVANRSLSSKARASRTDTGLSGIPAANTPVQAAAGALSFNGINHHQQRLEVASGNQWSLEPPDQALCIGNGFVVEAVNNAVAIYDMSGNRLALDSLNHFFGYPVEIDRSTGVAGPKQTTDPTCLFDPTTGQFFVTILTYDADGAGNFVPAGTNSLDTAVTTGGSPLGAWSITHIDATDDGLNGSQNHPNCPCLGDYPHIGVDATGYYITTNEYPVFSDGFNGAQIYGMSKAALASGASSIVVTQVDTSRAAPGQQPGFTVWPAQSPSTADYATAAGGTEYFLSTNAAPEANDADGVSNQLLTWSLTNTSSLASASAVALHVTSSTVGQYALPLAANQKVGSTPLADCLNLTACAKLTLGTPDKFKETERPLDALDARMQQVTYHAGLLYGSHGTALDPAGDTVQRAGLAWYITSPTTAGNGNLGQTIVAQGRVGVRGNNLVMPSLGVRADGSAVIGVTLAGNDWFPSAAYVNLSLAGTTGPVQVIAAGLGPEDGFAGYRGFGGRPRWGDYGAAALDPSGNLWVANEYIGQTCTFAQYTATPFGQCGGTRTSLANWYTRISRVAAP